MPDISPEFEAELKLDAPSAAPDPINTTPEPYNSYLTENRAQRRLEVLRVLTERSTFTDPRLASAEAAKAIVDVARIFSDFVEGV